MPSKGFGTNRPFEAVGAEVVEEPVPAVRMLGMVHELDVDCPPGAGEQKVSIPSPYQLTKIRRTQNPALGSAFDILLSEPSRLKPCDG